MDYGSLGRDWVELRLNSTLYKFKEGDFVDLHLSDIEDISLVIKKHIEDLHLGVESYQKKLNITEPQKTFPEIKFKELYTLSYNPSGVIYEDLNKHKRVTWPNELCKFSNGTLIKVWDELHHRTQFSFRIQRQDVKKKVEGY
ncbi:hypothetical protein Tco_0520133 [Tanacetum coccineum]